MGHGNEYSCKVFEGGTDWVCLDTQEGGPIGRWCVGLARGVP